MALPQVKAVRPRPQANVRAAATLAAGTDAGSRPARAALRRTVSLTTMTAADEDYVTSDSEAEPPAGAVGREERRSGGGPARGVVTGTLAGSAISKKKHNPW